MFHEGLPPHLLPIKPKTDQPTQSVEEAELPPSRRTPLLKTPEGTQFFRQLIHLRALEFQAHQHDNPLGEKLANQAFRERLYDFTTIEGWNQNTTLEKVEVIHQRSLESVQLAPDHT